MEHKMGVRKLKTQRKHLKAEKIINIKTLSTQDSFRYDKYNRMMTLLYLHSFTYKIIRINSRQDDTILSENKPREI